jgi:hypothetical protein
VGGLQLVRLEPTHDAPFEFEGVTLSEVVSADYGDGRGYRLRAWKRSGDIYVAEVLYQTALSGEYAHVTVYSGARPAVVRALLNHDACAGLRLSRDLIGKRAGHLQRAQLRARYYVALIAVLSALREHAAAEQKGGAADLPN